MDHRQLSEIRAQMKARKISGAKLAGYIDRSANWVNACLNGNYPYFGAVDDGKAMFPLNIERALERHGIGIITPPYEVESECPDASAAPSGV